MSPTLLLFFAILAAVVAAVRMQARREDVSTVLPARKVTPRAIEVAAAKRLGPLEWVSPPSRVASPDARQSRIRDRYIAARFPGVLRGSSDLRETEYVIKVARHYFEEGSLDDAAELFALAIEQSPGELTLRLAQLEIAFLARDAERFTRLARELHALNPDIAEWSEVMRLGHALAPAEPLFGACDPEAARDHYGPWPEMPNWIQASWDLTPEVLAADFHCAMARRLDEATRPALRRVA